MEFTVLGPVEIRRDDGSRISLFRSGERRLLAVLLLKLGEVTRSETLVDAVWGDDAPANWTATLHTYVSRVRRALGTGEARLLHHSGGYQLDVRPEQVDVHRFTSLTNDALAAVQAFDDHRAAQLFHQALALWRGTPLADVDSDWAHGSRIQLEEAKRSAILGYVDAKARLGQNVELIGDLFGWAAEYPLDENLAERLMLALARAGRRADALNQFSAIRNRLVDELGVDPSTPLQRAFLSILNDDVPTLTPTARPRATAPPRPSNSRVGRPEKVLDSSAGPIAVFAQQLRALRDEAGSPTHRELASRTGRHQTTLSKAMSGDRLPTLATTVALVRALGGDEDDWSRHWAQVSAALRPARAGNGHVRLVDWSRPGPVSTPAEFVQQMRLLRAWAGDPSLRQLAHRSGVPHNTLGDILRRDRLPRNAVLRAFLDACGVPEDIRPEWEAAWLTLAAGLTSPPADTV